jgi:hypothetical protein
VLCASNDAHDQVDPIIPPEGVPLGERVAFEGYANAPLPEVRGGKLGSCVHACFLWVWVWVWRFQCVCWGCCPACDARGTSEGRQLKVERALLLFFRARVGVALPCGL